jgi:hypothetical protein
MSRVVTVAVCLCLVAIVFLVFLRRKPGKQTEGAPHPAGPTGEPGRAAIDRALDQLYPDVRDIRMALTPAADEREPPLQEVVAYRLAHPSPHWLYVSYGLSEIGTKLSDDKERSGFGIELTLRLADASETPPVWPINYLRWLAKTVWQDRNPYDEGHSLPLPEGLLAKVSPHTEGMAFMVDPAIGTVKTSNGAVKFLLTVPLHGDEFNLISRWDANKLFAELRRQDPDLLWRVDRRSVLDGPRRDELLRQAASDGSSQQVDFTSELGWDNRGIHLDALNRHIVVKFLRYRVHYGRAAEIHSEDKVLRLEPGPFALNVDGKSALLRLPSDRSGALADALEQARTGATVSFDEHAVFVVGELKPLGRPLPASR